MLEDSTEQLPNYNRWFVNSECKRLAQQLSISGSADADLFTEGVPYPDESSQCVCVCVCCHSYDDAFKDNASPCLWLGVEWSALLSMAIQSAPLTMLHFLSKKPFPVFPRTPETFHLSRSFPNAWPLNGALWLPNLTLFRYVVMAKCALWSKVLISCHLWSAIDSCVIVIPTGLCPWASDRCVVSRAWEIAIAGDHFRGWFPCCFGHLPNHMQASRGADGQPHLALFGSCAAHNLFKTFLLVWHRHVSCVAVITSNFQSHP